MALRRRDARGPGRLGTGPARGTGGPGRGGLRHRRRDAHPDRGRIKADEPYYSQKHKQHGMNVQVIAAPDGTPLWFPRATPGRTHDLRGPRPRHRPSMPDPADPRAGRPGLPGCRRHPANPLPPPLRTARALPAVQPRPRPAAGSRRASLRTAEVLATDTARPMVNPTYRHRRTSHPHTVGAAVAAPGLGDTADVVHGPGREEAAEQPHDEPGRAADGRL
jgi:hypothetical protein